MNFEKLEARMKELYKKRKPEVLSIVQGLHMIADFKKESKDVIISAILEAEFGRKTLIEYNK